MGQPPSTLAIVSGNPLDSLGINPGTSWWWPLPSMTRLSPGDICARNWSCVISWWWPLPWMIWLSPDEINPSGLYTHTLAAWAIVSGKPFDSLGIGLVISWWLPLPWTIGLSLGKLSPLHHTHTHTHTHQCRSILTLDLLSGEICILISFGPSWCLIVPQLRGIYADLFCIGFNDSCIDPK